VSIEVAALRALGWVLELCTVGALLFVAREFAESIRDHLRPAPPPPEPQPVDPWAQVLATIKHPMQLPDGTWQQAELTWKKCEAPMRPNSVDIHDPSDPTHDAKSCSVCQHRPNYSGVSYRTS
jgi:hypothetical protein